YCGLLASSQRRVPVSRREWLYVHDNNFSRLGDIMRCGRLDCPSDVRVIGGFGFWLRGDGGQGPRFGAGWPEILARAGGSGRLLGREVPGSALPASGASWGFPGAFSADCAPGVNGQNETAPTGGRAEPDAARRKQVEIAEGPVHRRISATADTHSSLSLIESNASICTKGTVLLSRNSTQLGSAKCAEISITESQSAAVIAPLVHLTSGEVVRWPRLLLPSSPDFLRYL